MKSMRVVIVDDEPLGRRGVRLLLSNYRDVEIVAEAQDGRQAVRLLRKLEPDVVFLDVQMPEIDGFEVLRRLRGFRMPWVIFITAYDSFAIRAFDANALDYLVKPLREDRFEQALSRVRNRMQSEEAVRSAERLNALLDARNRETPEQASLDRLLVPDGNGAVLIGLDEIDWVEANDYYAAIHTRGRRILMRESLDELEARLGSGFVRAHRSAIVNLSRVEELRLKTRSAFLLLEDGTRVRVSRRRREIVHRAVEQFSR